MLDHLDFHIDESLYRVWAIELGLTDLKLREGVLLVELLPDLADGAEFLCPQSFVESELFSTDC